MSTTLNASALPREFVYQGIKLADPDENLSVEQVRELLTPAYPELATAAVIGPEDTGHTLRYTFQRAIGSKG